MLDDPAAPRPPPPPPAPRPAVALRPCAYVGIIIIIIIGRGRRWFKMSRCIEMKMCEGIRYDLQNTNKNDTCQPPSTLNIVNDEHMLILPDFLITQSDNSAKYIRTPSYANITWWVRCVHKDTRPSVYSMISPKILVL